jgi:predicted nucleic acid-binding protein
VADELLLDTGAFVALIDRDETAHKVCVAALESWRGPVITTEAVLTETLYLIGPNWQPQKSCLELFCEAHFKWSPPRARASKGFRR